MKFTPLNVTFAILVILLLVIVHEAGHFLAARAFGMRVLRFSIGLGPAIWRHKPKDSATTFQICAIPLLAYVQIDGMSPAAASARTFALAQVGGPPDTLTTNRVGGVAKGSPAQLAKLQEGDVVMAV